MNFRVVSLVLVLFVMSFSVEAGELFRKKNKKGDKVEVKKESAYEKFFKGKKCETVKGLLTIHKMDNKVYFELPLSLLGRDMLLGSTIAEISDNSFGSVGEKPHTPLHIQFTKTDSVINLRYVSLGYVTEDKNIQDRMDVSFKPAILRSFDIKAYNEDSTAVVIDLTDYLLSSERTIDPFSPYAPITGSDGSIERDFKKENCQIGKIKAFSDNVSVQSVLSYSVSVRNSQFYYVYQMPFTAVMTRSLILLPEKPMRPRMADPRINIFFTEMATFSNTGRGLQNTFYANRWRLEPKDMEAYKRGELVEPVQPIVFYIDDAFPEDWKPYIRQAVEIWQKPFEKIGFKNAIIAKDFPKDDPEFDPENLKYSCVRYCPSWVENAMGPSWVDPRTGEILNANVSVYHNIVNVVQCWRFIQTAQADEEVRTRVLREDILGDCLRYVVSHEVGHCLALMHNMASSAAIPTDSLRSPSFTQKYGTTYSIMDYARNNYVAQPGDKELGVRMTPPELGLYDYFSIKWLYTPLWDAKTSKEEVPTLDKWISEKSGNPIYRYGKQQIYSRLDPSAFEEDLSDDPVKAGRYGIKNLKYVLSHLNEWIPAADDKDYSYRQMIYNESIYQYLHYLTLAIYNIGGIYLYERYDGDKFPSYQTVSKEKQRESLSFLYEQLGDFAWLDDKQLQKGYPIRSDIGKDFESAIIDGILARFKAVALCSEKAPADAYTREDYLKDIYAYVWAPTRKGATLTGMEKKFQMKFLSFLIKGSGATESGLGGSKLAFKDDAIKIPEYILSKREEYFGVSPEKAICGCGANHGMKSLVGNPETQGFSFQVNVRPPEEPIEDLYFKTLKNSLALIKSKANTGSAETQQHYRLLIYKIEQALK